MAKTTEDTTTEDPQEVREVRRPSPADGLHRDTNYVEADPPRTGPNVDMGLVAGQVTVDPDSPAGRAAAVARDQHGAVAEQHDDGELVVTKPATRTPRPNNR